MRNEHGEYLDISSQSLWDNIQLFGLVADTDCPYSKLYGYWHPTEDYYSGSYYFPEEDDTEMDLISIFNPPVVDTAWDAMPTTA